MSLASRLAKLAVRALEGTAEREVAPVVRRAAAAPLAVRKALPAPPKVLALPAPKPKPKGKPRGGQFYPDAPLGGRDAQAAGFKVRDRGVNAPAGMRFQVIRPSGEGSGVFADTASDARRQADRYYAQTSAAHYNMSPEAAAREMRSDVNLIDWVPEGERDVGALHGKQLGDWLEKALTKYYKTDFGTEADPLRDLAARGLHFDPEMTPERWEQTVNDSLLKDPIGYFTVPRHESEILAENAPITLGGMQGDDVALAQQLAPGLRYYGNADPIAQGALMQAAPWLRKQPATDMLYGIRPEMDLSHFTDEMRNAMDAAERGLPSDLAVRPESLQRMSFPQAVEHVGKINQYRVKQMEAEQANILNNPAVQMFKEYPDDPRGLRWVEMRAPEPNESLLDETDRALLGMGASPEALNQRYAELQRQKLQEALRNEGDTMGHCVGGYCDDVLQGRSRIFSLRDAKGMPHVTVETSPGATRLGQIPDIELQQYPDLWEARKAYAAAPMGETSNLGGGLAGWLQRNRPDLHSKYAELTAPTPNIVQIKGKQNRAPNPEYLPFVQDFVKSGQWGEISDLGNTGLERLPDRRFITQAQLEEGINKFYEQGGRRSPYYNQPENWVPEDWEQLKPHFEGYARGGLAVRKCGCMQCGGLAVKRAA